MPASPPLPHTQSNTHMSFLWTRLDRKTPPYDLLFEDNELLAEKVSFQSHNYKVFGGFLPFTANKFVVRFKLTNTVLFQAFYLPGSVDVDGEQMDDWNRPTPSLYFWSHPDWTAKHMAIAQLQGHLCRGPKVSCAELCEDIPKTSTPSRESDHTADVCDDGTRTPRQSDEFCADKIKTSTPRQSEAIRRLDLLGFAPGPYRPQQNSSAGWLDE